MTQTQITLANSNAGTFDFYGAPPASLNWGSPGLTGAAYFGTDVGSYSLGTFGLDPAGPLSGGNFATSAFQAFAYSAPDGDGLTGNIHWTLVRDHSPAPALTGDLTIASVSGDAEFTSAFHAGDVASTDFLVALKYEGSPLLDDLAATTSATWTVISAGEIVPQGSIISEPGTLAVFGVALIVLWWSRRVGRGPWRREAF